jgi:signal transduction histidine kinase
VGLAYTAPASVTYSYRLEGVEEGWVEAGSRREVNYTHLSPGDYRFEVRACNSEGVCSVDPARLRLTIAAPFWRTGWFLAAMSLTLFACVYSVGRWRQAVRHRRDQERVELVRSLTVGVLHELRQPLQVIQSQIEILELDPATLETGVQALSAQLARLRNLLAELDELQHQPTLRTTPYARDDTMVDLSPKGEDD